MPPPQATGVVFHHFHCCGILPGSSEVLGALSTCPGPYRALASRRENKSPEASIDCTGKQCGKNSGHLDPLEAHKETGAEKKDQSPCSPKLGLLSVLRLATTIPLLQSPGENLNLFLNSAYTFDPFHPPDSPVSLSVPVRTFHLSHRH